MPMFKVTHRANDVEYVYAVEAANAEHAKDRVRQDLDLSPAHAVGCVHIDGPLKVYALNLKTGEMF
jgi:hypothetical protein